MNPSTKSARIMPKIFLILVLLFLNYCMSSYLFHTAFETITDDDSSYLWSHLHELTAEEDYGGVRELLDLYDLRQEEYDGLWNATEAYRLYCLYTASSQAVSSNTDPEFAALCEEQAELALTQLQAIPEDSSDKTADQAIARIKKMIP